MLSWLLVVSVCIMATAIDVDVDVDVDVVVDVDVDVVDARDLFAASPARRSGRHHAITTARVTS